MSFLGTNKYRDSWVQRTGNPSGFRSSSQAKTSETQQPQGLSEEKDGKQLEKSMNNLSFTRPKSANPTVRGSKTSSGVPKFVEFEKQVLRFICHIIEIDRESRISTPSNIRFLTLLIYLDDETFEIIEDKIPNSGITGGVFYRRNQLKRSDGQPYSVYDMEVGKTITALGQDITITDCDQFTRDYYKKSFGIILNPSMSRPEPILPSQSSQTSSTRNQSNIFFSPSQPTTTNPSALPKSTLTLSRSSDSSKKKTNFLTADNRILRFNAVELTNNNLSSASSIPGGRGRDRDRGGSKGTITGQSVPKSYSLSFFLSDDTIEVRLLSRMSHDEPSLHCKRNRIPCAQSQKNAERASEYLTALDLMCGSVVDVYGLKLLLLTCDEATRLYYDEINITQLDIVTDTSEGVGGEKEKETRQGREEYGNSLPIGYESESKHTRINRFQDEKESEDTVLRFRCELTTPSITSTLSPPSDSASFRPSSTPSSATQPNYRRGRTTPYSSLPSTQQPYSYPRPTTGQWFQAESSVSQRTLLCSYYLSDSSLSLSEGNSENLLLTGNGEGTGRNFLKRGRYINSLTEETCNESDIYRGNNLKINGYLLKILEIEEGSSIYCENHAKGDRFPYYNIETIADKVLLKITSPPFDLRSRISSLDKEGKGWVSLQDIVNTFQNDLEITSFLNEQEIDTLLRNFTQKDRDTEKKYNYEELCDLLSKRYYVQSIRSGTAFQMTTPTQSQPARKQTPSRGRERAGSTPKVIEQEAHSPTLTRYLTDLRGRQPSWRRTFRDSPESIGFYLPLNSIVDLLESNGAQISSSVIGEIVATYSLSQPEADTILQVKRQLQAKSQTTRNASSTRRPSGSGIGSSRISQEYDMERVVIDYSRLCRDIYPSSWMR